MPKKPGSTKKKPVSRPSQVRVLPKPKKIWHKPWTWINNLPAPARGPLPKARHILADATKQLLTHKKLFGSIALLYGLFNVLLVRGFATTSDLPTFKALLGSAFHGAWGEIQSSFTAFLYLVTTSGGGGTSSSSIAQIVLLVVISLAFIWSLRQVSAKHSPKVRDAFYNGMYPLIPFTLILFVFALQLVPMAVGSFIYNTAVTNHIATDLGQKAVFAVVFALLALWSLRMVTATIFALYIVTLPNMTPFQALRSARELVYKRRLLIWRKLILLPVSLLVIAAVVVLPFILFAVSIAEWVFFILTMFIAPYVHSYLYSLYRKLL